MIDMIIYIKPVNLECDVLVCGNASGERPLVGSKVGHSHTHHCSLLCLLLSHDSSLTSYTSSMSPPLTPPHLGVSYVFSYPRHTPC
jgi:hypothetical protein